MDSNLPVKSPNFCAYFFLEKESIAYIQFSKMCINSDSTTIFTY